MQVNSHTSALEEQVQKLSPVIRILIVEDDADDVYLLNNILHDDYRKLYETIACSSLSECQTKLDTQVFDLILLDLGLVDSQGLETLHRLQMHDHHTPIIVLTGNNDELLGEKAIQAGAEDFLPKAEMTRFMLRRAICYALERHKMRQELIQKAYEDALTGLLNRSSLFEKLNFLVSQFNRNPFPLAIALLDLDGFKPINDSLGHQAGDQVLIEIGQRLQNSIRASDIVARYGGDEFVFIFTHYQNHHNLQNILTQKQQQLCQPIMISDNNEVQIGASIGVTECRTGLTAMDLLQQADNAMYQSKHQGKNIITYYTPPPH